MYAVWHGPEGLRRIARRINLQAQLLAEAARAGGYRPRHDGFFDTIALEAGSRADALMEAASKAGYFNLRRIDATGVGIALDETMTREDCARLAVLLGGELRSACAVHFRPAIWRARSRRCCRRRCSAPTMPNMRCCAT